MKQQSSLATDRASLMSNEDNIKVDFKWLEDALCLKDAWKLKAKDILAALHEQAVETAAEIRDASSDTWARVTVDGHRLPGGIEGAIIKHATINSHLKRPREYQIPSMFVGSNPFYMIFTMYIGLAKRLKPGSAHLEKQKACTTLGELVAVSVLKEAGLEQNRFLYVRKEVEATWKFLEMGHPAAAIYGPPGIGKSSVVWAWACYQATENGSRLCWLHKLSGDLLHIAILSGTSIQFWQENADYPVDSIDADILIYDGATSDTVSTVFAYMREWSILGENRRIIAVSSDQTVLLMQTAIQSHISHSWQIKELYEASYLDDFYKEIRHALGDDRDPFVPLDQWRESDRELDGQLMGKRIKHLEHEREAEKELQEDEQQMVASTRAVLATLLQQHPQTLEAKLHATEEKINTTQAQRQREMDERLKAFDAKQSGERKQTDSAKERKTRREYIKRKFYVAGGSVRWMFGYKYSDVEQQILTLITAIPNKKDFLYGMLGGQSKQVVSHLLGRNPQGKHFVQSRFAACKIAVNVGAEFITMANLQPITSSNPSFDGWIFQMEFFYQLRAANRIKPQNVELVSRSVSDSSSLEVVSWTVPNIVDYYEPGDLHSYSSAKLAPTEQAVIVTNGDWLIPSRWNHACFDALQVCSDSLRVVQVTQAKAHGLKVEYIQAILNRLQAIGFRKLPVEIWIVVPELQMDEFELTSNSVRDKIQGWDRAKLRVAGLQRTKTSFLFMACADSKKCLPYDLPAPLLDGYCQPPDFI